MLNVAGDGICKTKVRERSVGIAWRPARVHKGPFFAALLDLLPGIFSH